MVATYIVMTWDIECKCKPILELWPAVFCEVNGVTEIKQCGSGPPKKYSKKVRQPFQCLSVISSLEMLKRRKQQRKSAPAGSAAVIPAYCQATRLSYSTRRYHGSKRSASSTKVLIRLDISKIPKHGCTGYLPELQITRFPRVYGPLYYPRQPILTACSHDAFTWLMH